jgi:sugar phosphate isomerase/epimerase
LLAALRTSGYPGAVSLELKPWPLGTPDPEIILERMRAALAFTREGIEGR